MQMVNLAHGPLYYRSRGEGKPLLLIHGWGGSSRYWKYTLEHFAPNYSVFALDLPGYGQSPPIEDAATGERLAEIVIEFADTMKLEQFDLIAHSFGCSVGAYLAARHPERVRRPVLTCFSTFQHEFERRMVDQLLRQMGMSVAMWHPWAAMWHPWMAVWQSWVSLWRPAMPVYVPSIYQSIAWRFFYTVPSDETILQEGIEDFLRMDQRTSLDSITSALSPSITTTLQQVATPTLLVGARQDMIMPESGVPVVQQLIPKCRLEWIDQCGHVPMIEKPAEYHHLVQTFLEEADDYGASAV